MPLFNVTIENSEHQFQSSNKESVLHSGLLAGLNLKYGCDNGQCGDCIAQLKSGRLDKIKHSDFVMDRQQKRLHGFLMCCYAAASDIKINAVEHGSENEIAEQTIQAKVYKIHQLSKYVKEIEFKTPRSQPLKFFAGQYVTITLPNGACRNKSLSGCPCDGVKPSIHVQYQPLNDPFSDYVFLSLKKNDVITMLGPKGHFTLDDSSHAPIILIAYETGMASIKGLIEHLMALQKEQTIKLFHIHTQDCDHYLENYCRAVDDALDNFKYMQVAIKDTDIESLSGAFQNILDKQQLLLKEGVVYAALPKFFHQQASDLLLSAGIEKERFKMDYLEHI